MPLQFEYLRNDENFQDAKIYRFEAIHVTTTANRRKYTQKEMQLGARSLSFRPLNRNHDHNKFLPHPENTTLVTKFDSMRMAVVGEMRISDPSIQVLIDTGRIKKLSIEQHPTEGETCDDFSCEQHGVVFTAMALLDAGIIPGDSNAEIKTESLRLETIENITECKACPEIFSESTGKSLDDQMIEVLDHSFKHFPEIEINQRIKICSELVPNYESIMESDDCVGNCLRAKKAAGNTIDDQAKAICISECGKSSEAASWWFYKKYEKFK